MDARREARAMVIPLPSFATPQTRFLVATRRDGPDSAHRGVAARLLWRAQRRGPRLALPPNPGRRARGVKPDRLLGAVPATPSDPSTYFQIMEPFHGTTILSVRRGKRVALGGDGQVTLGNVVVKASARKVRRLYHDKILAGFAGGTADAFTLFERFEAKLDKHQGNLMRSAVELAKDWRTDRMLRRLEAMLIVADRDSSLIITGNGDVLEPELGLVAIGSGGAYAHAAARALL